MQVPPKLISVQSTMVSLPRSTRVAFWAGAANAIPIIEEKAIIDLFMPKAPRKAVIYING
jgi:hypothetical protein